jgi:hypothetical protein
VKYRDNDCGVSRPSQPADSSVYVTAVSQHRGKASLARFALTNSVCRNHSNRSANPQQIEYTAKEMTD